MLHTKNSLDTGSGYSVYIFSLDLIMKKQRKKPKTLKKMLWSLI